MIAPILIMIWFSQKQLVRGLTFGAVKYGDHRIGTQLRLIKSARPSVRLMTFRRWI
jgi:hypothetical protein